MKLSKALLLSAGCGALVAAFFAGSYSGASRVRAQNEWTDGKLLSSAIDSVRANALDSLPTDELLRRAVSGMLRELHDPYAALLKPDSYQRYRGSLQGEGRGLGLTLRRQLGVVSVVRVAPNSPAASGGVRPGDRILTVNNFPVADGWGRPASDTTSAPLDTARISVWRAPSGDTARLTVVRGEWHAPSITDAGMLTDSVGYLRLGAITAGSAEELEHAVDSLLQAGARSLMLDLRGNAGGLLEEGVKAAGLFLPRGTLIASLDSRKGAPPEPHFSHRSRWTALPLTVLVDENTASSAEIIAGALRDHRRALLVGTRTYGKGLVQRVVKLTPELSLRLTTATWLTPGGESLVRRQAKGDSVTGGLSPDVLVDDATRPDPFAMPKTWSRIRTVELSNAADSASFMALREGWSIAPISVLESRLGATISVLTPKTLKTETARSSWVGAGVRLATVRLFEAGGSTDAMLRYSARDDAALRAGLEVLSPGSDIVTTLPPAQVRDSATRRATTGRSSR